MSTALVDVRVVFFDSFVAYDSKTKLVALSQNHILF